MEKACLALKRIPRIKFPQRLPKPSSTGSKPKIETIGNDTLSEEALRFFERLIAESSASWGGKASLQPKRTPMSKEEMEVILSGGCS